MGGIMPDKKIDWRDPDAQKPAEKVYSPWNPFLDEGPPEWFDFITDEEWDQIEDMKQRAQVGNLLTPKDRALIERIAANRWMLMENVFGWRCGRCGIRHDYITTGCIERPMNGADEILYMLHEVTGNDAYTEDNVYSMIRAGTIQYISANEAKKLLGEIVDRFGEKFLTTPQRHRRSGLVTVRNVKF